METKISNDGFREISDAGLMELNGGSIAAAIIGGLVSAVCVVIFTDWDNFKNGLMGGPEIKN